ncbi:hypothetical protein L596_025561 [Steinernema carpocapsae]|uniref:Uncharacterized protein n=1 Tax=Steinernema carpocapsae TaxID=34508 RepID=A0A4U5M838_STECR|nr:hypothetical protein L596_025561 [Steinernema carpocapsae]
MANNAIVFFRTNAFPDLLLVFSWACTNLAFAVCTAHPFCAFADVPLLAMTFLLIAKPFYFYRVEAGRARTLVVLAAEIAVLSPLLYALAFHDFRVADEYRKILLSTTAAVIAVRYVVDTRSLEDSNVIWWITPPPTNPITFCTHEPFRYFGILGEYLFLVIFVNSLCRTRLRNPLENADYPLWRFLANLHLEFFHWTGSMLLLFFPMYGEPIEDVMWKLSRLFVVGIDDVLWML